MPGKDGTGPIYGRGRNCHGKGLRGFLLGNCKCPQCGKTISHTAGMPCTGEKCPDCGALMVKE